MLRFSDDDLAAVPDDAQRRAGIDLWLLQFVETGEDIEAGTARSTHRLGQG
jgi:hypothetical protein